jgi:hypothetical protein
MSLLAQPVNPWLEEARLLSRELRFADAIERLKVARTVPGLDDAQRREVLELLARCQLAEGQRSDAEDSLTELLRAEPAFELDRKETSPKILDAFDQAKKRLYPDDFAALTAIPAPAGRVAIKVIDPWRRVREVHRFERVDGGPWHDALCVIEGGAVSFVVAVSAGSTLEWYAEARGDDAILARLGSEGAPQVVTTAKLEVVAETLPPLRWQRPAAWALISAALAAAAIGAVLQVNGWSLRLAARDRSKPPGDWSDTALEADRDGKLQTTFALGLFIGAGAAGLGGGILFAW